MTSQATPAEAAFCAEHGFGEFYPTSANMLYRFNKDDVRDGKAGSLRLFITKDSRVWVASCSGNEFQTKARDTVEAAFVAAELANWGQA